MAKPGRTTSHRHQMMSDAAQLISKWTKLLKESYLHLSHIRVAYVFLLADMILKSFWCRTVFLYFFTIHNKNTNFVKRSTLWNYAKLLLLFYQTSTSLRQFGQFLWNASQELTQQVWKACLQGNTRIFSIVLYSSMQMGHSSENEWSEWLPRSTTWTRRGLLSGFSFEYNEK